VCSYSRSHQPDAALISPSLSGRLTRTDGSLLLPTNLSALVAMQHEAAAPRNMRTFRPRPLFVTRRHGPPAPFPSRVERRRFVSGCQRSRRRASDQPIFPAFPRQFGLVRSRPLPASRRGSLGSTPPLSSEGDWGFSNQPPPAPPPPEEGAGGFSFAGLGGFGAPGVGA